MKFLIKSVIVLVTLVFLAIGVASFTGNGYLIKGVALTYLKGYSTANIGDAKDFDTRIVNASTKPYVLAKSTNQIEISSELENEMRSTGTVGTMLIVNDSVKWEKYFENHNPSATSNSFSAVKTMICFLVQIAIQEGKIPSWNTPVKKFLPWLTGKYADSLTLFHLAAMSSGLDWNEHYTDPFCVTAKAYYGSDIEGLMKTLPIKDKPGVKWVYQSGNTQLLGLVLKQVYNKDISSVFSSKLWQPIGAQTKATWNLDSKDGMELTYCCLSASVADFAKMGLLVLHKGSLNNTRILDSSFINKATMPAFDPVYGTGFWITTIKGERVVFFQGHLGQFIAVIPSKNAVFVRVGNHTKGPGPIHACFTKYIQEVLIVLK